MCITEYDEDRAFAEQREEGREEGREEERTRLAENFRKIGVSEEQIRKALEM